MRHTPPLSSPASRSTTGASTGLPAWKRAIDLAGSIAALPFLALIAVFMAVLTRLTSPGPLIFKQERVGRHGTRFLCYKFRTMHVAANTSCHQRHLRDVIRNGRTMQKLDARGDDRVIRGAGLIRALGLDELPQIINVLRGEMSLVGPRPCIPYEYAEYTVEQRRRCEAVPGLTGLWQVSGKNRTTFARMVELDIEYAHTLSFLRDLRIIALTLPAVLRQAWDSRPSKRASALAPSVPFPAPTR